MGELEVRAGWLGPLILIGWVPQWCAWRVHFRLAIEVLYDPAGDGAGEIRVATPVSLRERLRRLHQMQGAEHGRR